MSTRTIVTSQPDVACDVCQRRLLRGEQSEAFLEAGRPRTVCELCAPRAAHEGWLRASDGGAVSEPPARPRRGRSLLGRLLASGRLEGRSRAFAAGRDAVDATVDGRVTTPTPFDFVGEGRGEQALDGAAPQDGGPALTGVEHAVASADAQLEQAITAFNAGEGPRRVASLARSLGAPEVNVRTDEDLGVVLIVVAWELCWYRYRVDFGEQGVAVSVIAQGTELEELERCERVTNAAVDAGGAVSLTGVVA